MVDGLQQRWDPKLSISTGKPFSTVIEIIVIIYNAEVRKTKNQTLYGTLQGQMAKNLQVGLFLFFFLTNSPQNVLV